MEGGTTTETTNVLINAFKTALEGTVSSVEQYVSTALPYALTVMGLLLGIRIGVNFFKSLAN